MHLKEIQLPPLTEDLAELAGAFIGDGCMPIPTNYDYSVCLYGNLKKDVEYVNYLANILRKLFGLNVKINKFEKRNLIYIRIRSKRLCQFFGNTFNFAYGPKYNIDIPTHIKENKELLISCIRGIFDTDGCVSVQKDRGYKYPFVSIGTTSQPLAQTLKENLVKLGFGAYTCITKIHARSTMAGYAVRVKGQKQIDRWIKIIRSNNPRNMQKLLEFRSK